MKLNLFLVAVLILFSLSDLLPSGHPGYGEIGIIKRESITIKTVKPVPETGSDAYVIKGPNAHPSTGNAGKMQTEIFTVPDNRAITSVTQECIDGPCGFSYNPDGGYEIWYRIYDGGTKVEWKRKHTSHPVTYRVKVHWKTL